MTEVAIVISKRHALLAFLLASKLVFAQSTVITDVDDQPVNPIMTIKVVEVKGSARAVGIVGSVKVKKKGKNRYEFLCIQSDFKDVDIIELGKESALQLLEADGSTINLSSGPKSQWYRIEYYNEKP